MALPLNATVQDRLAAAQDRLTEAEARVRWVAPGNLHLTIKFFGEIEDRLLGDVCDVAANAATEIPPFAFEVAGLQAVPPHGALRMIWVDVHEPTGALQRLHGLLETACEELGFRAEQRGYRPHLTLGRVKGGKNAAELRSLAAEQADETFGTVEATELVVYGSVLSSSGPTYTALSHVTLTG